ncbi:MAG: hypothetical protein K6T65_13535 [Peptococcaceae bacterium]|nr:hypothetical protein [Peptococcaceae bacterium]
MNPDKATRSMRLYIAKINMDMTIWCYKIKEAQALLEDVLMTESGKNVVFSDGTEWAFAETSVRDDGVISGKLGRKVTGKKTDLSGDRFVKVSDYKWQYSNFVITSNKKYIIFEKRDYISVNQFKKRFSQICEHFRAELGCLMIETIRDESQLFTLLSKAEKIFNFSYYIRIPNPHGENLDWAPVLNDLNDANADSIYQKYNSSDGKINYGSGKITAVVKMVAKGLGNFKALIARKGKKAPISSDDSNINIKVECSDIPSECIDVFINSFEEITKISGGDNN